MTKKTTIKNLKELDEYMNAKLIKLSKKYPTLCTDYLEEMHAIFDWAGAELYMLKNGNKMKKKMNKMLKPREGTKYKITDVKDDSFSVEAIKPTSKKEKVFKPCLACGVAMNRARGKNGNEMICMNDECWGNYKNRNK